MISRLSPSRHYCKYQMCRGSRGVPHFTLLWFPSPSMSLRTTRFMALQGTKSATSSVSTGTTAASTPATGTSGCLGNGGSSSTGTQAAVATIAAIVIAAVMSGLLMTSPRAVAPLNLMQYDCEADMVPDLKEGRMRLNIEGFDAGEMESHRMEVQEIFVSAYNNASGMCDDFYQRILQSSTLQSRESYDNDTVILTGLDVTDTSWSATVQCQGCPDVDPLFSIPNATALAPIRYLAVEDEMHTPNTTANTTAHRIDHVLYGSNATFYNATGTTTPTSREEFLQRFLALFNSLLQQRFGSRVVYIAILDVSYMMPEVIIRSDIPSMTPSQDPSLYPSSQPVATAPSISVSASPDNFPSNSPNHVPSMPTSSQPSTSRAPEPILDATMKPSTSPPTAPFRGSPVLLQSAAPTIGATLSSPTSATPSTSYTTVTPGNPNVPPTAVSTTGPTTVRTSIPTTGSTTVSTRSPATETPQLVSTFSQPNLRPTATTAPTRSPTDQATLPLVPTRLSPSNPTAKPTAVPTRVTTLGPSSVSTPRTTPAPTSQPFAVVRFALVDAEADVYIPGYEDLQDGVILDRAQLPQQLTIEAICDPPEIGEVRFFLDGSFVRTEKIVPYALASDVGGLGDYKPAGALEPTGEKKVLKAVPIWWWGFEGTSHEISFTVIDSTI
jgi:hypothetical protein